MAGGSEGDGWTGEPLSLAGGWAAPSSARAAGSLVKNSRNEDSLETGSPSLGSPMEKSLTLDMNSTSPKRNPRRR